MPNENSVIFKGRKGGLVIALDNKTDFEVIKETLAFKLVNAKKFFGNTDTSIIFKGRNLTEAEEDELIGIITQTSGLSVYYTQSTGERMLAAEGGNGIEKKLSAESDSCLEMVQTHSLIDLSAHQTKFHMGSLRSGQSIKYVGSVVVVGDVNPGAEIIAEGNIVVLGALKGLAHAGCGGNSKCFVSALDMKPTQLRIADRITYVPATDKAQSKRKKAAAPLYAYVQDDRICMSNLV